MKAERDMAKEREYYSAGYLIIEKCDRGEWMDDRILPTKVVSASKCICDGYPLMWGLSHSWRRDDDVFAFNVPSKPPGQKLQGRDEIVNHVKNRLDLDRKSYSKLRKWIKREHRAGHIEFPNIFLDLNTAKEFHQKYLEHILDLEIIGMGVSKETIDKYRRDEKRSQMRWIAERRMRSEAPVRGLFFERLEDYMPDERTFKMREDSLLVVLSRYEPIDPSGAVLGFEILGDDGCYNFHSPICNHLETDLKDDLGVRFNESGFIDSFEDADRSALFINQCEDAESSYWYPCLIVRYDTL